MSPSVCFRNICLAALLTLSTQTVTLSANIISLGNIFVEQNDVTWKSLGGSQADSMPIGNGDLAANVWTETNGDLVVLLAKNDAWTEGGKLVKLGRVRIKLEPNPFTDNKFSQTLNLKSATIELKSGDNVIRIWADANHPVIHIDGNLAQPATIEADVEFWRKTQPFGENWTSMSDLKAASGDAAPHSAPDIIFPATSHRLAWAHYNPDSTIPYTLKQEHLDSSIGKYSDPLLHRCFGAIVSGPSLVSDGNQSLHSSRPTTNVRLDIAGITVKSCASPKAWLHAADTLADSIETVDLGELRRAHDSWWQAFWNRSWIHVTGNPSGPQVEQGYTMQRYMMACSSRGEMPVKFNGGLFTVGHDAGAPPTTGASASTKGASTEIAKNKKKDRNADHDPDYRAWGDCYWNQNNRLLYWPLIESGDIDLIKPWFDVYLNALPLATDRARTYYHHDGALFPETFYFWGLPSLNDFGTKNPSNEIQSRWQKYHIQGSLEIIAQMLDVYDQTQDADFAKTKLVPFADAIVTFYDQHYARDANGKMRIAPAQSLETYQLVAVNPTPDIAGLVDVLPRLIALPAGVATDAQRQAWRKEFDSLPPIPMGRTAHGKLPPLGQGDPDGTPTILPAQEYGKPGNSENPELYVAFPYRLYGVGKPNLKLAQDTFAARRSPQNTCWGQDGTQAAVLGLTDVAQKAVIAEFTNYGDQRFPWFWRPGHDWIPDLDNGGDGMITLELMLMQCDGKRIQLLPAWPHGWTTDFKLHAPYQTTVEGHVENGKVTNLKVSPAVRTKDIVILSGGK